MQGHSNGLLKALPQLAAISNKTGKACSQINITSPEALSIMQTLLGEVMDLFPGVKWHHLGADEVSWSPQCNMTKANYHRFINTMNTFVRSRNRTMVVWEGFDPAPEDDAPPIDKTVVVSPFDSVHLTPWPHRPHHYYDAGYNIINTVRPLARLLIVLSQVSWFLSRFFHFNFGVLISWRRFLFAHRIGTRCISCLARIRDLLRARRCSVHGTQLNTVGKTAL